MSFALYNHSALNMNYSFKKTRIKLRKGMDTLRAFFLEDEKQNWHSMIP